MAVVKPDYLKVSREMLIELLAWQFASPVRWIETQHVLFASRNRGGLGIENAIEVGIGEQPTVANMAKYTLKLMGSEATLIQNIEADYNRIFGRDEDQRVVSEVEETAMLTEEAPASPIVQPGGPLQ